MSKINIIAILIILSFKLNSQSLNTPEKIRKITEICHTHEYYKAQVSLWKKEVDKNPKNEAAWFNYYKANRYEIATGGNDTSFCISRFKSINSLIDEMEKNIPNTYEFNICKWLNGGNNPKLFPFLEKAHKLKPNEVEPLIDLLTYYEIQGDSSKRNIYTKKWFETGETSPGLLNYSYNVLQSLKPNAIIITYGDNDTYPLWILQTAFGIRKDIKVQNISMIYNYDYTKRLNQELGINIPNCEENCKGLLVLIENLIKNKYHRPIYLTLTNEIEEEVKSKYQKKLFLTGLAYEYSDKELDNIALLKKNIDKNFALDYLTANFTNDKSISQVKEMNTNYVVPFVTLYKHYKESEEIEKSAKYKSLIEKIMKDAGRESELKEIFK